VNKADVLVVEGLAVDYKLRRQTSRAVSDVGFQVAAGETVALVGESGSGKSTIGNAVVGLVPITAGQVILNGKDITHATGRQRRSFAGQVQMIFQNPYGSLNPALTVEQILAEPLTAGLGLSFREAASRTVELLERVHLPADVMKRRPGAFSGGQRQRIAIARAVALRPSLIICDEPTSALDVTTQAAVLDLLAELQREINMSYLFITHDLAVVKSFASRVVVLQHGRIVETGTSSQVCNAPINPYTRALVAAAPVPDPVIQRQRRVARLGALSMAESGVSN